jgi:hypothetical protein
MPNWCFNKVVVTGPADEIDRFKQTCIRPDQEEEGNIFDFETIIPMPTILEDTESSSSVDDALLILGHPEAMGRKWGDESLGTRMQQLGLQDIEAFKAKLGEKAFEEARRSIQAFDQTGFANWYDWKNANWGTKWNASGFVILVDEPGRYEFTLDTAWSPPVPVWEKLGEMFPTLDFDLCCAEPLMEFAYEGTIRAGKLQLTKLDPATVFGRGTVAQQVGRGWIALDNLDNELGEFQTEEEAWAFLQQPELQEKLMAQYRDGEQQTSETA